MTATAVQHEGKHLQDITVRMHQFETEGDQLAGYLLEVNDVELENGNKGREYVLQLEYGDGIETFLETHEIEKAFRYFRGGIPAAKNCFVCITYQGSKDIGREDGGKLKKFKVQIDPNSKLPNCATVGDDDISFLARK